MIKHKKIKNILTNNKKQKSDVKFDRFVNKFCVFCLDNDLHLKTIYDLSNKIINNDSIEYVVGMHEPTFNKLIEDNYLFNTIKIMLSE